MALVQAFEVRVPLSCWWLASFHAASLEPAAHRTWEARRASSTLEDEPGPIC
jgi:hypothetical protein